MMVEHTRSYNKFWVVPTDVRGEDNVVREVSSTTKMMTGYSRYICYTIY